MHVFLSYARSSEEQATNAERALRDEGYVVWRDTELPAHLSYAEVIEERLKSAKAVLVLWSAEAAKSQWVRAEADAARERGTLVQSSVDGTVPPIPFNQIQCADLKGWNGEADHPGWRKLHSSIVALAGAVEEPAKPTVKERRAKTLVCVLPFQNQSGDGVPDFFTDGLSEDITTDLAKLAGLAVVPRKTAFQFKGQDVDALNVAETLGAAYVLEGTVRRAGDRVRITTQLIDERGEQAWSDRYYRDFTDVFAVQDEMSRTIVEALRPVLAPGPPETTAEPVKAKAEKPAAGKAKEKVAPVIDEPALVADSTDHQAPLPELDPDPALVSVSLADRSFGPEDGEPAEDMSEREAWPEDDEAEPGWRRPRFALTDHGPRLAGFALVLLLFAVLAYFLWPQSTAPVAAKEPENMSFTVTKTVNVRSLPSRYNSRILGTLEEGTTINIVPDLAGAQPEWLKIEDGPYVGGYVWRESTRPTAEAAKVGDAAAPPTERKDATG